MQSAFRTGLFAAALSSGSFIGALAAPARAAETEPPGPPPPPPAYSLPWQLRPTAAATTIRSDTSFAFLENAASNGGSTIVSFLSGSYKVARDVAPFVRFGALSSSPPTGNGAFAVVNPAAGVLYAPSIGKDLRLGLFLGMTAPIGMGGGSNPDPDVAAAVKSGVLARSAMDNAMFAVNDFAVFPGVGFAYVGHGLTAQAEVTLFQLARVKGDAVQKDASRTNLTSGIHVGYFIVPELSFGAELRYQRWLSTPAAVAADSTLRDNLSFAIGPRLHFRLTDSVSFHPGVAYARGLEKPMTAMNYNIAQLDLPLAFR